MCFQTTCPPQFLSAVLFASSLSKDILKKFNPSITGFSTGTLDNKAGLNVAEEGARAQ
jgi:hypothetical protein